MHRATPRQFSLTRFMVDAKRHQTRPAPSRTSQRFVLTLSLPCLYLNKSGTVVEVTSEACTSSPSTSTRVFVPALCLSVLGTRLDFLQTMSEQYSTENTIQYNL